MKNRTLFLLALLIAAQHIFFLAYFPPILQPDSGGYIAPAQTLASSLSFESTTRLPGYPAFLAVFYRIFGDTNLPVIIFQHLLGLGVYLAVLSMFTNRRSKIVFSVLFFCDLLYASYQHAIVSETLFSFLLCMSAIEFHYYKKTGRLPHLLICGALVAAGIFTKPVLKFFPVIILAFLFAERKPLMKKAASAAVFLLVPVLAINLWSWHNYKHHGKFALLTFETLHYTCRLLNHIEFPKNSVTKESFMRNMDKGWIPMSRKAAITFAIVDDLKKEKGLTEAEINTEFKKIYILSILRHPFIYAKETGREVFYFFFSAHNLYAKYLFKDRLPYSADEAIAKRDFSGLAFKIAASMHPFYWLLFLLTVFFTVTRWRELLAGSDGFATYGLALIVYIGGVTSMANAGLANYRCPVQPFMLFCASLVIAAWFQDKDTPPRDRKSQSPGRA